MPTLEDELRRYGELLDTASDAAEPGHTFAVTEGSRPRRAARTALAAAAVVAIVIVVAVVASARPTHEVPPGTSTHSTVAPTAPTTPTVTTASPTTTDAVEAWADNDRRAGNTWIQAHGGTPVALGGPFGPVTVTPRAVFAISSPAYTPTLARIDRGTHRVTFLPLDGSTASVAVGGDALYVQTNVGESWELQRVDPDTLDVKWTVSLGGADNVSSQQAVAGGPDFVWDSAGRHLEQRDARTGHVQRTIPLSVAKDDVDATLALSPDLRTLYVAYGDFGGGTEPIETRDAATGRRLAYRASGVGSIGLPRPTATSTGVWLSYATGMQGAATFFRAPDLRPAAALTIGNQTSFGMGVDLAVSGSTLWASNFDFVACADARTGRELNRIGPPDQEHNVNAESIAADSTTVAVSVGGVVGIFPTHALCPQAP